MYLTTSQIDRKIEKRKTEEFSCDNFIKQINVKLNQNQKIEKFCDSILGGYKITYICDDLKFIYRTTEFWLSDYVMIGSDRISIKSKDSLSLIEYFEELKF